MSSGKHNVSLTSLCALTDSQGGALRPDWADVRQRFWSKVRVLDDDRACWTWTASQTTRGYGQFTWAARFGRTYPVGAHRVAYELTHGVEIPQGQEILHSCDNRLCVNPKHLSLGTHTDNMRDASQKGRMSVPRQRTRGFKDEAVARYIAGEGTLDEIAARYGIHKMTLRRWLGGQVERYARPHGRWKPKKATHAA